MILDDVSAAAGVESANGSSIWSMSSRRNERYRGRISSVSFAQLSGSRVRATFRLEQNSDRLSVSAILARTNG
jgi:hypothetical protein